MRQLKCYRVATLARDTEQGNPGENRVRLALVAELKNCVEAAERIADAIKQAGEMATASNLNKAERIAYIDDRLQALYPETPVPLDHTDPYTLLIAVLLSAQCTDERVNQVTPGLFAKADCPEDMVQLSVEEIRSIIRPCGLSPQNRKQFIA